MKFINKIIIIIFCCTFFSCKTKHNSPVRGVMTHTKVGDSIRKTGYLIYDSKKEFISFIESDSIDINSFSRRNIINMTNQAKYIVLLREGLNKFKESRYISLSLCHVSDKRLVVEINNLLYKRFHVVYLKDYAFYLSMKDYADKKQRLFFCKVE
jgi:hypothetical protein